jgi:hypothetical protein
VNYTPRPPLPSDQRISRLSLWLHLTVAWFAAHVLALFAPHQAARELKRYARYARFLLMIRTLKQTPWPRRRRRACTPGHIRHMTWRRIAGGVLRRALHTGSLRDRANAIYAAMTAPERWLAHIARRLKRRFTKLRRLPAARRTQACAVTFAPQAAAAINSS